LSGWVKVHRQLLDKPIWVNSTPEQKTILMTILMMANHEENKWEFKGEIYKVKPGQFITSLSKLAEKAGKGISIQNVRTALVRFEKLGFLTNESTKQNRLITIVNWGLYQGDGNEITDKLTDDQQTANKQLTTNKNDNNKYIYTVFEHWCSKGIIAHKKLNKKMESHINARLQEHGLDEILKAIDNYHTILTDDKYYWTYKWTLQDFMKPNNIVRFLDSSEPFVSFLKNKNDNVIRFERPEPRGRDIPRGFDYEKAKTAGEDPNW